MKGVNILTGEQLDGVQFFTQFVRPLAVFEEEVDETSITEQSYVPVQQQIRDMTNAGLFLDAARKARFDSDLSYNPEEDIALDPARNPGADVVDILKAGAEAGRRIREQDLAAAAKRAEGLAADAVKARDELAQKIQGKTLDEVRQILKEASRTA